MREETYRTCIGCCTSVAEELIVEAFFARPTVDLAAAVCEMLNARGYQVSAEELLEVMGQS